MTSTDGWLFIEDAALKHKLQGITVSDVNALPTGRTVGVRYRLPETEFGELTFPHIIIEHQDITKDSDREHHGRIALPYAPDGYDPWWAPDATHFNPNDSQYITDFPVPMIIRYQITVLARKAVHLNDIVRKLLTDASRLPPRSGYLEVPQDHTIRTMDLLGGPDIQYGKDGDDKTLHRATFLIGVFSEILLAEIYQFARVTELHLTLSSYTDSDDIKFTPNGIEYWRKSKSQQATWNTN